MGKVTANDIKDFFLFKDVSAAELNQIAQMSTPKTFRHGEIICAEKEQSHSLFLIKKGIVEVLQQGVSLAKLPEGDYFGEMSLMADIAIRHATAKAYGEVLLYEIEFATFRPLVDKSTSLLSNIIFTYDRRLRNENSVVIKQFVQLENKFEELKAAHEQLPQTDKLASIGTLTASIAHEVNNPLTIILGRLSVLEAKNSKETVPQEDLTKAIKNMTKAAESIKHIILGLKTYVRIDDGQDTLIDLNTAVQGSIDLVSFLYNKQENIDLSFNLCNAKLPVKANIGKIQQVVLNLLSNSKDAMEERLMKKITIETRRENNKAVLSLSDTGEGIPEDKLTKIFDKFYTTKPSGKGTGLGLEIISTIIKNYGGEISVKSQVGKGTTFTITLPLSL